MVTALRWVAVLPAAIAGYMLAVIAVLLLFALAPNDSLYFIVGWVAGWLSGLTESPRDVTVDLFSAFFRAWGFVTLGTMVAPSHRVQTAIALSGTALALIAFVLGLAALALIPILQDHWRLALYAAVYLALFVWGLVVAVRGVQEKAAKDAD